MRSEEVQPFLENEFPQATKAGAMFGPYLTSNAGGPFFGDPSKYMISVNEKTQQKIMKTMPKARSFHIKGVLERIHLI